MRHEWLSPVAVPSPALFHGTPSKPDGGSHQWAAEGAAGTQATDFSVPGTPADPSALLPWMDDLSTSTMRAEAGGPAVPVSHGSREIKVEWGEGAISGGLVLTVEVGPTGVPLNDSGFKLLESTASTKLNGFARRLETSLMTGEFDAEVFEGFKLAFETNLATVGVEGDELEVDLLSCSVKVVGDATKLIGAPAGTTVSLDGRLTFSLGGKLAAKLATFAAAQAEQKLLLKQMADLTDEVGDHAKQLKAAKTELEALEQAGRKLYPDAGKLRQAVQFQEGSLSNKSFKLKQLGNKLGGAKRKAAEAITKVFGKIARKIAQQLEKKAVMMVAKSLAKLVPVLNIVSTIIDVVEILGLFSRLISGGGSETGSDEETAEETKSKDIDAASHAASATDADSVAQADEPKLTDLSPAATAILDALKKKGTGQDFNDDQRVLIGLLVPQDLTPQEVAAVVAELTRSGAKAPTPEDAIAAIDAAVRSVRDRTRTQAIKVNGVSSPSAVDADDDGDADVDTATTDGEPGTVTVTDQQRAPFDSKEDGPITSPSQVATVLDLVQSGDPNVIRDWFELKGDTLVMSAAGRAWRSAHAMTMIAPNIDLRSVKPTIVRRSSGIWDLSITFVVEDNGAKKSLVHHYFVMSAPDAVGPGSSSELVFEPFTLIEL